MVTLTRTVRYVVSAQTQLQSVLGGLTFGGSALLGDSGLSQTADQFNWQYSFARDKARRSAIAMGMVQSSQNPTNECWIGQFNEAANGWTGATYVFPETNRGHVYGGFTYDPATGKTYFLENGCLVNRIAVHNHGDPYNVWSYIGVNPETKGAPSNQLYVHSGSTDFVSSSGVLQWHPTLFGSRGGLIIGTQKGFLWYDVLNDQYGSLVNQATWNGVTGGATMNAPGAVFIRGLGYALISVGSGGSNALFQVNSSTSVIQMPDTPLRMGFDTGGGNEMKPVDSPIGAADCLALETGKGVATRRVWRWSHASKTFVEQVGVTHPFVVSDNEDVVFAFVDEAPVGGIWGIGESGGGWQSRIWRYW